MPTACSNLGLRLARSSLGRGGGVETRELVPTTRKDFSDAMPFPGRTTRSLVFTGRDGRALMRLSVAMQPRDSMRRLLEVCAARTGLTEQFRRIKVPDL